MLDISIYDLSDRDCDLLYASDMLQERHLSIRQCAKECNISKSTLHEFISNGPLQRISYELYQLCKKQLDWNKRNISYFMKHRK